MDVLRPTLIRIGGRIYRKNLIQEQAYQEEEEDDFCAGPGDCADEPCDAFVVEETEKGFQCRVEVPSPLYKYIIGKKGETKKRLETETRTSISIPKPGVEGEIVITGQHRSGVTSARTRIDVLLDSFRKKQPFTHFLSFALNQPAIQEKFLQFKEEVLEKCSKDHGVSSSLFQNPAKLHLTLGTLVLLNEQEIQKACDLLQRCKEDFVDQITGGKPLTVEVAGVEYMNDDPATTDILYAQVHMKDGSDKLQVIADRLVERFVASGLMLKEWNRVKLHATVMNTLFRKDPGAEERNSTVTGKSSFKERESFNGRNILKCLASEPRLLRTESFETRMLWWDGDLPDPQSRAALTLRELLLWRGAAGFSASFPEVLHRCLRLLRDVWAAELLKWQHGCRSRSTHQ
ncbi:activating signal cointegrator 1 complex subunit 1 isoform X1 [Phaenicophaeus curvirostris]|uniref:activating signal cointegrator 1 complex subunit 1 isoform X1 n=1 Tax=Phaenicophaeus curvirostris TaxID=33595 RepID=UPI0037F0F58F